MSKPIETMMLDRVDEHDRVVGTIQRVDVFAQKAGFRVIHLFIFNDQNELLLQQISQHGRHPGYWGSSVAGYVASGETYDEAITRRLSQELNVVEANLKFIGKTYLNDDGCKKFISIYTTQHNGPFEPDPAHIAAVEFVSLSDVSRMAAAGERQFTLTFLHVFDFFTATSKP